MDSVLPDRVEVVAMADSLAVSASRAGGEEGAKLTRNAADLRARLWRLENREADGLEAVELLRGLEKHGGEIGCEARLDRALLQAELSTDPTQAYREAYVVRAGSPRGKCAARARTVLQTLSAFRPLPNVLAELDRQVGEASGKTAADAGPSGVRVDERGPIVVPTLGPTASKGPVRITSVERYGAENAARIVVLVTHPTTFDVGYIPRQSPTRGPRLYVDVHRAKYRGKLAFDVGGFVERVRLGQQKGATRVVLDLSADAYRKVFYLPEPFRLVIDVSAEPPDAAAKPTSGERTVRRVVLDPGHGGHDPGAVGPSGLAEKDVTLDVAHRAAPLIARELGIATLLTRDSDVYVPLAERTARANAFQADLFVSLHCNASEDPESNGVMTFVLDHSGDALASSIAARENAASASAAAELANVLSRVQDATTLSRCVNFAELLQRAAVASLHAGYPQVADRGVRRAGFYVLAGARMPAVLFEISFISNPIGEMRLNTADYRQKLADAVVNAVRAYREGR
jgi:N-acetylmuramoyl-L-alanine amidase